MAGDFLDDLVAAIREDPRARLIYLFGSRARGGGRTGSDTDLAVLFDPLAARPDERELRARLEELADGPVDLVILNDAGVVLRHEIVTGGRCLWARDPGEQAEFEIQVLSQYVDFQPVLKLQEEYLRRRIEERLRGAAT